MPDDRLFHKSLGHSEKVNSLTDFEDLTWRSYVLAADDFGVMRFSALTLQADNDRLSRKPQKTVQRALQRISDVDLIRTFEHQGRTYCYQWDWQDWQKITYPKRTVNPTLPAEAMMSCSDNTRWLFTLHPGGKKLTSWQCPESFRRNSGKPPENSGEILDKFPIQESLTRGRALTLTKTNGYDSGEPFSSFTPELPVDAVDRRAGEFIERYKQLHVKLRRGAHYVGKPSLDFEEAKQLVGVYEDTRLDKLAYVWLNTDHNFAQNGSRTLAKFRSMASWCEEQLIDWEDQHGPLKVTL